MTENLLQQLEEKMMLVLSEVEELRKEVKYLTHENAELRTDREKALNEKMQNEDKLRNLLSLFEDEQVIEPQPQVVNANLMTGKPVLIQG